MLPFLSKKPRPAAAVPAPAVHKDPLREAAETVVFVVALVLLLKLFVVEAFVIPTGSMAETLYGYQKTVACQDCGHEYPVNASEEADPQDGVVKPVTGATCPNCRYHATLKPPAPRYASGDRVLVHKALYPLVHGPGRGDIVVFKYPVDPQVQHTAQNYIKRLWGLGNETIAIYRGDLYVNPDLQYPAGEVNPFDQRQMKLPRPDSPLKLWEGPKAFDHSRTQPRYAADNVDYTYHNVEAALAAFETSRAAGFVPGNAGGFTLIRKPDELALAMRRVVYDNDHPSNMLAKAGVPPRWTADPTPAGVGWTADDPGKPKTFTHAGPERHRLGYAHRVSGPPSEAVDAAGTPILDSLGNRVVNDDWGKLGGLGYKNGLFPPGPVTNFLGYNTAEEFNGPRRPGHGERWVPDLMVECAATVSDPRDEVSLDLAKGSRRFRATFKDGKVALSADGISVAEAPTRVTRAGTYDLRFGNIDGRLRAWVNGRALEFGAAADLPPWGVPAPADALGAVAGVLPLTGPDGFSPANDLAPAAVYAAGAVTVAKLKLWQDTYFTPADNQTYADRDNPVDTFYVHPGHYLCLGDNSGFSSDSRKWGLVPDRLLLGKAQFIFFPFDRVGFIK